MGAIKQMQRDRKTAIPDALKLVYLTQLRFRRLPEFSGLSTANQATLTHRLRRPDQIRIARRASAYVVAAFSGILTLMSIFVGIKVSAATAWSGAGPKAVPALQMVDRTGKGDRLPLLPVVGPDSDGRLLGVRRTPVPAHQLVDGCESLVSVLSNSPLAQIEGRCMS